MIGFDLLKKIIDDPQIVSLIVSLLLILWYLAKYTKSPNTFTDYLKYKKRRNENFKKRR